MGTFATLLEQGEYTPVLLKTSIYELYEPLIESGEFDSLPVYLWNKGLLECPENVRPRDLFSLIYLVFDFDPLYHLYDPDKIRALQEHFSDETKDGLLYINYPMVESVLDVEETESGLRVRAERRLCVCSSGAYKGLVRKETPLRSSSDHPLRFLPPKTFAQVSLACLSRYRELMSANGQWSFSDNAGLLEKEISATEKGVVFPLSCLPFMALDYNAQDALEEWREALDSR